MSEAGRFAEPPRFAGVFPSRIDERHHQGGVPVDLQLLKPWGVDVVVFCAEEVQPYVHPDHGLIALYCPFDDVEEVPSDVKIRTMKVARRAEELRRQGKRVLVTCRMGRNRSGLVSALMLILRHGISGAEAVRWVQRTRPDALTNDAFVDYLVREFK